MTHFHSFTIIITCFVFPKSAQRQITHNLALSLCLPLEFMMCACVSVCVSRFQPLISHHLMNTYLALTAACIHHLGGEMPGWCSDMLFAADSFRIITSRRRENS